jgi:CRP-like cAMP-binding protein
MSPVNRTYQAGSIIYFEGDKSETVYILQSGSVRLTYLAPDGTGEVREIIKNGEFFGVKSAMGRFAREETATVLVDSSTLNMTVQEFEKLVLANHKLVIKMLKVFSNQLRRLGKIVQMRMDESTVVPDGSGLFNIGEYYLVNKKFPQAVYAYQKYLQFYSKGEFVSLCQERIAMAEKGVAPDPAKMRRTFEKASAASRAAALEAAPGAASAAVPEAVPHEGGVASVVPASKEGYDAYSGISVAKRYFGAYSLFTAGKFEEAYNEYKFILDKATSAGAEYIDKSYLDSAICLINMNKYGDAIQQFTRMLTKFPSSPNIKQALFSIGQCYVGLGEKEKAKVFFVKVKGTPPLDALNKKAEQELAGLGVGG